MKPAHCFLSTAFALVLAGSGSEASSQAQPRDSTILVTGQAPVEGDAARRIVERIAVRRDGQLARFEAPVCPEVSGFPEPYAGIVAERIRSVAREAGARVAGAGCTPNLHLVIVDDGPGFARELHRAQPGAFAGIARAELRRLTQEAGPTRGWTKTMVRDANGRVPNVAPSDRGTESAASPVSQPSSAIGGTRVLRVDRTSLVNPQVVQSIEHSFVVLETRAIFGMDLLQVADYAAMRGLAITAPALPAGEHSILTLFAGAPDRAPRRLTAVDRGYLAGLYGAPANLTAAAQGAAIARSIERMTAQQTR
ncbi:MAG TPA: hypothetical protein VD887_03910 [Allosphingosinicella sp.]|nr:hypothetical protein [Allosphingosinicella sp.]